jgi:hypothetical protein
MIARLALVFALPAWLAACPTPGPVIEPPPPPLPEPVAPSLQCALDAPFPRLGLGLHAWRALRCDVVGEPTSGLTLTQLDLPLPYSADGFVPGDHASGGTLELRVRYAPSTAGEHPATARLPYTHAAGAAEATVPLAGSAYGWGEGPAPRACRADGAAPLLDQVLALAGLDRKRFTFTAAELAESTYETGGFLADPFVLSWFKPARGAPARVGCLEGDLVAPLDHFLGAPHPVAGMIRHAAGLLDRPVEADALPYLGGDVEESWSEALNAFCAGPAGPCEDLEGQMPPDLGKALVPVLRALSEGVRVRHARDAALAVRTADFWRDHGGNLLLFQNPQPDPAAAEDRAYLVGADRDALYRAAAQLAFAIQDVDWSRFEGLLGVDFSLRSAAGWIRVRDAATHEYPDDGQPWLLHLDLGGDDVYRHPGASNRSAQNAVSVVLDLGGDDHYTYDTVTTPHDREGLPAADAHGRFAGNAQYGPISLSRTYRQGAAQNGIALHFDLGDGHDRYESLRASQGYAHQGVGVLFDAGGDDRYVAEALSQGAGQFGIGLLIDAGPGRDERRSFTYSQGFGYVGGAGFLVDGGGDDLYLCDHGDPAAGGIRLYYSPQMPTDGNNSFCQGAGFGRRATSVLTHLSGGLGVLRDLGGDDRYEASVFAQGTGFWQGTGLLSDGAGADTFDAYYYAQGGAAHYAVGVLADSGDGDDRFNTTRPARHVTLGTGHDYSVGALLNEAGNSEYRISSLSAGASNCNGIGLFVDNAGDDLYLASSDYGSGMGNVSSECISTRPTAVSIGLMIDARGQDTYSYPASAFAVPSEGGTWGHARNAKASEHGGGVDGDGESGVHPESAR